MSITSRPILECIDAMCDIYPKGLESTKAAKAAQASSLSEALQALGMAWRTLDQFYSLDRDYGDAENWEPEAEIEWINKMSQEPQWVNSVVTYAVAKHFGFQRSSWQPSFQKDNFEKLRKMSHTCQGILVHGRFGKHSYAAGALPKRVSTQMANGRRLDGYLYPKGAKRVNVFTSISIIAVSCNETGGNQMVYYKTSADEKALIYGTAFDEFISDTAQCFLYPKGSSYTQFTYSWPALCRFHAYVDELNWPADLPPLLGAHFYPQLIVPVKGSAKLLVEVKSAPFFTKGFHALAFLCINRAISQKMAFYRHQYRVYTEGASQAILGVLEAEQIADRLRKGKVSPSLMQNWRGLTQKTEILDQIFPDKDIGSIVLFHAFKRSAATNFAEYVTAYFDAKSYQLSTYQRALEEVCEVVQEARAKELNHFFFSKEADKMRLAALKKRFSRGENLQDLSWILNNPMQMMLWTSAARKIGFIDSSWKPQKTFSQLQTILQKEGPFITVGYNGLASYPPPAIPKRSVIDGKEYITHGFAPTSTRLPGTNVAVVIGAERLGGVDTVFVIDSLYENGMFTFDYKTFCDNAVPFLNPPRMNADGSYAITESTYGLVVAPAPTSLAADEGTVAAAAAGGPASAAE